MSIYEQMVQAGVKVENHCSDMYVPKNAITEQIISTYDFPAMVTVFRDNIDHELWYCIAFAYDPFWTQKDKDVPW